MRIRMTVLAAIAGIAFVAAAGGDRSPAEVQAQAPAVEYTGDVIVKFDPGVTLPEVAQAISDADGSAVASSAGSGLVLVQPQEGQSLQDALGDLKSNPDVAFAEADTVMRADLMPNDPLANNASYNWSLNEIGAPTAWDATTGNANVIVAVVDTGVDGTPVDLLGKLTSGANTGKNFIQIGLNTSSNVGGWTRMRTATAHPYHSGDSITVAGHTTAAYNGVHELFVPQTNISSVTNVGGAVRVTTSAAHQLATGDMVNIRGNVSQVTYLGSTRGISGDWTVTVSSSTQFTLNNASFVSGNAGGQAKVASYMDLLGEAFTSVGAGGTATNNSPRDDHMHGTFVAGIIAANTNNSTGMAGVCWSCKIMPVKVLDHEGYGSSFGVVQGIDWAVANGADVINLSLGGGGAATLQTAVNNAWAAGVIVVAATGNDNGPVSYPAAYGNAIAVGSTQQGGARSSFSNYGPEIDIVAPGSNVLGTICQCNGGAGGYGTGSGTSFSTPYVAGAAALLIASGVTDKNEVRTQLLTTATDLGTGGFDNLYGNGRLNIGAAVEPAGTPPVVSVTSPGNGATVSGSVTINVTATDDGSIQRVWFYIDNIYLRSDAIAPYNAVWDAAGSPGAHQIRVRAYDNDGLFTDTTVNVTVSSDSPPIVGISSPSNGATVGGSVSIDATASDDVGVQRVWFYVDEVYLRSDAAAPYNAVWDTTELSGSHQIRVRAYDTAGQFTDITRTVTVSSDVTPPTVSITSPANGATIAGVLAITVDASDASGIQRVWFYIDDVYLRSDALAPYTASWAGGAASPGPHVLRVRAYDNAGNYTDTTISFTSE